ncbi:MAG: helix-turn-helix domain-containing protein [Defluviitaleaceae bacterium]|nr:helix-turn-helix domain-containing protein [Defluviitaleaceae bacterium]
MQNIIFSREFRKLRKQRGLSQYELANPHFHASYISKIENGEFIPSVEKLAFLSERLGVSLDIFHSFLVTEEEIEFKNNIVKLRNYINGGNRADAEFKLAQLKKDEEYEKRLIHKQEIIMLEALLFKKAGKPYEYKLTEAIEINIPNFQIENIEDYSLTTIDTEIITLMISAIEEKGRLSYAISLFYKLNDCFDTQYTDFKLIAYMKPFLTTKLVSLLFKNGEYEKVIELSNNAINLEVKNKYIRSTPWLNYNKANALYELGHKNAAKETMVEAFYNFKTLKDQTMTERIKKELLEKHNINIENFY